MGYKSKFMNADEWNAIDSNIRFVRDGRLTHDARNFLPVLRNNGVTTIIRYYASSKRSKTVTRAEVKVLSKEGFYILPVYQDNARRTRDFGQTKGAVAGRNALEFIEYVSQPKGTSIFFAVDTDFTTSQIKDYVVPYFRGVNNVLGEDFRIGAYGSGATMEILLDKGLIELTWLSMSRGFRGTKDYFENKNWHMRQIPPDRKFRGIHYDKNHMMIPPTSIGAFQFGDPDIKDCEEESFVEHVTHTVTEFVRKYID